MAVFVGTFENRVDSKGRVSVPADFRQELAGQSYQGIVVFPSHRCDALEGSGTDFIERMVESVTEIDLFSEEEDDLTSTLFGAARRLPFDGEGRIVLPKAFCEAAGITKTACFVGKGHLFQIWEPERLQRHMAEARRRAKEKGLTLSLRPKRGGEA